MKQEPFFVTGTQNIGCSARARVRRCPCCMRFDVSLCTRSILLVQFRALFAEMSCVYRTGGISRRLPSSVRSCFLSQVGGTSRSLVRPWLSINIKESFVFVDGRSRIMPGAKNNWLVQMADYTCASKMFTIPMDGTCSLHESSLRD